MAGVREGSRLAKALGQRQLPLRTASSCARRFASTQSNDLSDLDTTTAFSTPAPDAKVLETFNAAQKAKTKENRLPGNRYQYHPPKYNRGPLHPVQVPVASDPTARDFVPGPFNFPRLKHTYDTTIAPDLLTMTYQHAPPGTIPPKSEKGTLRQWDDSSPYHKNRPSRGPRGGGSSRLGLLERPIAFNNIPEIKAITVNTYAPLAASNKEYLQVTRAILQAITGAFPEISTVKSNVVQWKVRQGDRAGARATLRGPAAYEFVDKLVTLVLPKIKDWAGINATTGDGAGNLALGLKPEWLSFFPELEYNYDMYPSKMVPGCDIFIQTTGTSDRQARLLLEALGFPFYGKATH